MDQKDASHRQRGSIQYPVMSGISCYKLGDYRKCKAYMETSLKLPYRGEKLVEIKYMHVLDNLPITWETSIFEAFSKHRSNWPELTIPPGSQGFWRNERTTRCCLSYSVSNNNVQCLKTAHPRSLLVRRKLARQNNLRVEAGWSFMIYLGMYFEG